MHYFKYFVMCMCWLYSFVKLVFKIVRDKISKGYTDFLILSLK